jgi:putative transcriptional regulator
MGGGYGVCGSVRNQVVSLVSLRQSTFRVGMAESSKSLRGQLLLDGGKLQGSFFHRSVVLICQHDAEGAFGLILNRSTENKVGDAIVADLPEKLKDQILFIGGPVQPTALSYLHSDIMLPDANVMDSLRLGHSLDGLMDIADSYSPSQKVRMFAGYAGWDAGQLDKEMARKDWLVHPASIDLVFHTRPDQLWQNILKQKGMILLANAPEDLSWN